MKILMFMVLALVSTNVFAGEVMPQQSGVPMTDPQGFPGEPQHFADPNMVAPQGNQPMPAPLGTPFPDGDPNLVAPQHPPVGVPHAPHFVPNQVPLGAPIGSPNAPLAPHMSGAPTPCTPGVAPVPQQGIVPQS